MKIQQFKLEDLPIGAEFYFERPHAEGSFINNLAGACIVNGEKNEFGVIPWRSKSGEFVTHAKGFITVFVVNKKEEANE